MIGSLGGDRRIDRDLLVCLGCLPSFLQTQLHFAREVFDLQKEVSEEEEKKQESQGERRKEKEEEEVVKCDGLFACKEGGVYTDGEMP